jgi:hypothetical protein
LRGGVTLIVSAPEVDRSGRPGDPQVRYAISKRLTGEEGRRREARQREYFMSLGLLNGNTADPKHFQVDFGLLHQGF